MKARKKVQSATANLTGRLHVVIAGCASSVKSFSENLSLAQRHEKARKLALAAAQLAACQFDGRCSDCRQKCLQNHFPLRPIPQN